MPAAIAIPLITGVIGGATTITAAKMASNAAKRGTQAQTTAAQQALDVEKAQHLDDVARYNAWLSGVGTPPNGAQTLGQAMKPYTGTDVRAMAVNGIPAPRAPQTAPPQSPMAMPNGAPQTLGQAGFGQAAGMGPTITVIAPNGQQQQRPATERDHWIQKGARVI